MTISLRNLEPLSSIGLSATETKVYLALLELGPSKAGVIIKFTGIQNSVMHLTLGKLSAQGFVSYIRRGKMKIYQAADPQSLLRLMDERRQRLQSVIPQLEALRSKVKMPEAEIYEGMHGLRNMCFKLIEGVKKGDDFLFFGFACKDQEWEGLVYEFYREYTFIRLDRGLRIRGIAHVDMRPRFVEHKWPHSSIRFVPFPALRNMSICNDRVMIVPWEETQTSFLITSKSFAQNCRDYFNEVWETTRKS